MIAPPSTTEAPRGGPSFVRRTGRAARQFGWYLVNGGIATALDWTVFAVMKGPFAIDYRLAVTISFICGAACNFQLQKRITFRDRTRGGTQVVIYLVIVAASLLATVGLMVGFVRLGVPGMLARILTTGLMTAANFLLHRLITFNRRVYARLQTFH